LRRTNARRRARSLTSRYKLPARRLRIGSAEHGLNSLRLTGADDAINFAPAREHHETGQTVYAILFGQRSILIDVDFSHGVARRGKLGDDRIHRPARPAPIGPKIQQNGAIGSSAD
jgi:hypothetical protein